MNRRGFPSGGLVLAALACSLALWAVMVFGTLPRLQGLAGGLAPFDLRPTGYALEEARALLAALGEDGRGYYQRVQLRLDAIYPATYAASRGLALWWLTEPGRLGPFPLGVRVRAALVALPLAAGLFDYGENALIARMLAAGADVDRDLVVLASFATSAKSLFSATTELALLGAAGLALWFRRRRRRASD